jgi:hypothetical protein
MEEIPEMSNNPCQKEEDELINAKLEWEKAVAKNSDLLPPT